MTPKIKSKRHFFPQCPAKNFAGEYDRTAVFFYCFAGAGYLPPPKV
jgi:hypothetical protein